MYCRSSTVNFLWRKCCNKWRDLICQV